MVFHFLLESCKTILNLEARKGLPEKKFTVPADNRFDKSRKCLKSSSVAVKTTFIFDFDTVYFMARLSKVFHSYILLYCISPASMVVQSRRSKMLMVCKFGGLEKTLISCQVPMSIAYSQTKIG